jgi:hypothetical protein
MEIISSIENQEKIKINKMHVLVHPGYLEDVTSRETGNIAKGQALFEKYKKVAQNLPRNEIMVVLIHNRPEEFYKDFKEGANYVKNIKSIQQGTQPKQVIILTSNTVPFSGADERYDSEALDKIKSIAQNRGYEISPETEVEVFGETHDECVQEAFLGIKNTGFFKTENIRIVKELTDKF